MMPIIANTLLPVFGEFGVAIFGGRLAMAYILILKQDGRSVKT